MLQWFIRFPDFAEFSEFSVAFRENSITMEALTAARWKTAKIHRIEHSPGMYKLFTNNGKLHIFYINSTQLLISRASLNTWGPR